MTNNNTSELSVYPHPPCLCMWRTELDFTGTEKDVAWCTVALTPSYAFPFSLNIRFFFVFIVAHLFLFAQIPGAFIRSLTGSSGPETVIDILESFSK